MRLYLSIAIVLIFVSHAIAQESTNKNFIPSHESNIVLLTMQNTKLYSLDSLGMLLIQDIKTFRNMFFNISRRGIVSANFQYPYLVFTTSQNTLEVYNILDHSYLLQVQSDGTIAIFSQSKKIFIYNTDTSLELLDVASLTVQRSIPNDKTLKPIFVEISKNAKNIMIYHDDGSITYFNIATGEMLKHIAASFPLQGIIMNDNKRFAVGHTQGILSSIDTITGAVISNFVFKNIILNIFPAYEDNTQVLVLSELPDNTQTVRIFDFFPNGTLKEKDLAKITGLQDVSYIIKQSSNIYIGNNNGTIDAHNITTKSITSIHSDSTIAIYDTKIIDNTLLLARKDGLQKIDMDTIISERTPTTVQYSPIMPDDFIPLEFHQPKFFDHKNTPTEFSILSQTPKDTLLFQFDTKDYSFTSHTLDASPTDVLLLSFNTIISYSKQKSTLTITSGDSRTTYPILIPNILFTMQDNNNTLSLDTETQNTPPTHHTFWMNYPVHLNSITPPDIVNTTLWAYTISSNAIATEQELLVLPFRSNSITYLQQIKNTDTSFIIFQEDYDHATSDANTTLSSNPLITKDIKVFSIYKKHSLSSNNIGNDNMKNAVSNSNQNSDIPQSTIIKELLATIPANDPIIHAIPIGEHNRSVLILTISRIIVLSLDNNSQEFMKEYRIPYPKELGAPLQISATGQYISIVDKNNTVAVFEYNRSGLQHRVSLLLDHESNIILSTSRTQAQ